jgi:hypothetical protein
MAVRRGKGSGGAGGGGIPAEAFALQQDKKRATVAPVGKLADLKGPWQREYPVYWTFIVEVTRRRGSQLSFRFVGADGAVQRRTYTVDLDDGGSVQRDLPSTAPLVTPGSKKALGYLLLTEAWVAANVAPAAPAATAARTLAPAPAADLARGPKIPAIWSL